MRVALMLFFFFPVGNFAQQLLSSYTYMGQKYISTLNDSIVETESRCDCDYVEKVLMLMDDSTFVLKDQSGYISPKMEYTYGTWHMKNDSTLVISATHYQGSTFVPTKIYKSKKKRIPLDYVRTQIFTIRGRYIWDGYRLWNW